MIRIGINGLGRIGRAVLRLGFGDPDINVVAVNDLLKGPNLAFLLQFDSVHGRYGYDIQCQNNGILIENQRIRVFNRKNPLLLPWRKLKVDAVVEATGRFRSLRSAGLHRLAGAKRVVLTANPANGSSKKMPVIIRGMNEGSYAGESIISASSCSANCAGPVIKVLHDHFTIQYGFMTAIHAYTRDQALLDTGHLSDWRRGRAAACNIVPSPSDAASRVANSLPGLEGKLQGMTLRVPVADGSLMNIVCKLEKPADKASINTILQQKSAYDLSGILALTEAPIVSRDILNCTHSAMVDAGLTRVMPASTAQVCCWFDHEFGYAARVLDLIKLVV